jgi:hypothetical protein
VARMHAAAQAPLITITRVSEGAETLLFQVGLRPRAHAHTHTVAHTHTERDLCAQTHGGDTKRTRTGWAVLTMLVCADGEGAAAGKV